MSDPDQDQGERAPVHGQPLLPGREGPRALPGAQANGKGPRGLPSVPFPARNLLQPTGVWTGGGVVGFAQARHPPAWGAP